jgi:hypothetical protein
LPLLASRLINAAGSTGQVRATTDEYFDYAPPDIPPQGRWRIYGIDLPDSILRKVYNGNAAGLLNIAS